MKRHTLAITALVTALSTASAFAWQGDNKGDSGNSGNNGSRFQHCETSMGSGNYNHMGGWHGNKTMKRGKALDRSYTAEEIKTLSEARLIRRGNPNIKVGKVTPTKDGYKVTIVTKDNSLVKELDLAKNGMPLEHYKRLSKKSQS